MGDIVGKARAPGSLGALQYHNLNVRRNCWRVYFCPPFPS